MADEPTTMLLKAPPDDGLIARLASQRARFRDQFRTSEAKVTKLKEDLDRLTKEADELRKVADTSAAVKRVAELEGRLRDVEHRKSFDRLAKGKGATEAALDDLWKLSEYKAETEQVDEAALATLLDAQKTARPYLFGTNGNTANSPSNSPNSPPPKPGPGSGQGGSTTATQQFSQDQLADPKFVMSNFADISQAAGDRMKRGEI